MRRARLEPQSVARVSGRALKAVATVVIGLVFVIHLAPASTPASALVDEGEGSATASPAPADSRIAALEASLEDARLRLAALEEACCERTPDARPLSAAKSHAAIREQIEPPPQRFAREPRDPRWSQKASDEIYDWWYASPAPSPALVAVDCRASLCAIEIDDAAGGEDVLEQLLWDPPWNAAVHTETDPERGSTRVFLERTAAGPSQGWK